MCGFAGYVGADIPEVLEKMAAAIVHRGPDGGGFYRDGAVHFAHRRLAVIDLDEAAGQPMQTADGELCVIFNGEIYNHRELRRQLEQRGHVFRTRSSDTEVLLHGWREWGVALPERLDGMWAFVIYDRPGGRLFASRDRFGKKPFFYTRQNGVFTFASELSCLRAHPGIGGNIDAASLRKYFAYGFIPAPRTIYENIFKLPPGHNLTYDLAAEKLDCRQYWDFVAEPRDFRPEDEPALCEELRELLAAAVKKRLQADVPVGVLLSGGVDSSSVAVLADRAVKAENPAADIATFSIGFTAASYDESPYAERIAEMLHSRHFLTLTTEKEVLEHALPLLSRLDEPMSDDSLLPTWLVCREARRRVTVALGGDGGDELFAGYEPFRFWQWASRYRKYLPKCVHAAVAALVDRVPASQQYIAMSLKLKRFFRASAGNLNIWVPSLLSPLAPGEIAELLGDGTPLEDVYSEAVDAWDSCASPDPVDRMTRYYVKLYLADQLLVKSDRASMLNSLELRCPYLDKDLADFARRLPGRLRVHNGLWGGGETKYLLKKALEPLLPHDILYRKKRGFSPPAGMWFQSGELAIPDSLRFGNPGFAARALAAHRTNRTDHKLYLWAQLTLEQWGKQ